MAAQHNQTALQLTPQTGQVDVPVLQGGAAQAHGAFQDLISNKAPQAPGGHANQLLW